MNDRFEQIIEQMGDVDTWPAWAQKAFDNGTLFKTCLQRIDWLEEVIRKLGHGAMIEAMDLLEE